VESGEGIERQLSSLLGADGLDFDLWNPVKELKGCLRPVKLIRTTSVVESGEGIER